MEDNLGDVRTLLDQGADTEIRNSRGQTALLLALSENRDVRMTRLWVVRVFAMCSIVMRNWGFLPTSIVWWKRRKAGSGVGPSEELWAFVGRSEDRRRAKGRALGILNG